MPLSIVVDEIILITYSLLSVYAFLNFEMSTPIVASKINLTGH